MKLRLSVVLILVLWFYCGTHALMPCGPSSRSTGYLKNTRWVSNARDLSTSEAYPFMGDLDPKKAEEMRDTLKTTKPWVVGRSGRGLCVDARNYVGRVPV